MLPALTLRDVRCALSSDQTISALRLVAKGRLQTFPAFECPVTIRRAHRVSVKWQCATQLLGILSFRLVTPRMIRKVVAAQARLCRPTATRAAGCFEPIRSSSVSSREQTMGLVHGAAYSGVWRMA
jgi:hypothetical protein